RRACRLRSPARPPPTSCDAGSRRESHRSSGSRARYGGAPSARRARGPPNRETLEPRLPVAVQVGKLEHVPGARVVGPRRSVTYNHLSIALSAAESGHGVALSSGFLCAQRLATGRLPAPFEVRAHSASTYHVVSRPEGLDDPRIVALR